MGPDETTGCDRCDFVYRASDDLTRACKLLQAAKRKLAFALGPRSPEEKHLSTLIEQIGLLDIGICQDRADCDGGPLLMVWVPK